MARIELGKRNKIRLGLLTIYLLFGFLIVCAVIPIVTVITKSVSSEKVILSGKSGILPDFSTAHLDAYKMVFSNVSFLLGLKNTIVVTLFGTFIALIVTSCAAYALSKPYLRFRRSLIVLCIFIMIFSGGLIPTYLVMNMLGLVNTFHILWLAGIFSVTNMLIIKNSFEAVPHELEEAAIIDGAGHLSILFRVYLPISKAVLSVIALYYAVEYWNNYFTSMIYTTKTSLRSLQLVLKDIIYSASDVFLALHDGASLGEVTSQSTIAACIIVATLPILVVYPFLQKYFTRGVLLGSVKG